MPVRKTESKDLVSKSPSSLVEAGVLATLSPASREQFIMAEVLAKSQAVPMHWIAKPAAIFSAVQWGKELNIDPMTALNNIYNVEGRMAVSTSLHYGLAAKHPAFRGMLKHKVKDPKSESTVTVKRAFPKVTEKKNQKGEVVSVERSEEVLSYESTFTIQMAKQANLIKLDKTSSAWVKYPERMLFNRALALALRDAFPDVLTGVYTYEELKPDISVEEMRNVTEG